MKFLIAWALLGLAGPLAAQDTYLDDRSNPEALVASLYNAINTRDFARAWSYFDPNSAPSYSAYIRGFDDTDRVEARTEVAVLTQDGDTRSWQIPVVLVSHQIDGTVQVYAGCYLVGQAAQRRRPPYAPIAILSGHFHVHDGPAETAHGDCTWAESSSRVISR